MINIKEELRKIVDDNNIFTDEPMKAHTSFKIGGPADFFVKTKNVKQLKSIKMLASDNNIPFTIVGNGSNLLVTDKGIRGIVVKLDFDSLDIDADTRRNICKW